MSMIKGAVLVAAIMGCAVSASANRADGETCAAQLTPDGKAIYAAAVAAGVEKGTITSTIEREARSLVDARKIAWDVARDNGVAAAICVTQLLQ